MRTRVAKLIFGVSLAPTSACASAGDSAYTATRPVGPAAISRPMPIPSTLSDAVEVGSETETACNTTTHLCSPPCTLEIATGGYHTCARKADGSVWCWGGNEYGQVEGANVRVGDGVRENTIKPSPVQALSLATSAVEITSGYTHSCARKADGSVWCWGGWTFNATPGPPVELEALGRSVVEIADTCVRKSDGSVWCWGSNKSSPVQVAALGTSAVEITGTCARKDDGSVWCWKRTLDGVVGDAVEVAALGAGAVEIATGAEHTCARKGDGSIWCWGRNDSGQLGDGTKKNKPSPVQVTDLGANAVEITAGYHHTCARKRDGSVWCWGKNERGQLGDGTTTLKTSPVQVTALGTSAIDIAAGGHHTCARKNDGSVWCWGWNDWGQLGDGTTKNRSTPGPTILGCETMPSKEQPFEP